MLIAAALNAGGQILGGIGAKQEAELTQFQMRTQKTQNRTSAMQQARARREEYDLATSANIAAFALQGRDITTDRSVEAFLSRQEEIANEDSARIEAQTRAEDLRLDMMAMAEGRRGRNALYASLFDAVGTMGEAGYRYKKVKVPKITSGGGGK
jgi:hypothetical protein